MEETFIRDWQEKAHLCAQNFFSTKAKPHTKEAQVFKEVANPENNM